MSGSRTAEQDAWVRRVLGINVGVAEGSIEDLVEGRRAASRRALAAENAHAAFADYVRARDGETSLVVIKAALLRCERAVADWRTAARGSDVNNASAVLERRVALEREQLDTLAVQLAEMDQLLAQVREAGDDMAQSTIQAQLVDRFEKLAG